ncbi:putative zinc-binding protein [Aeromonas veronii]|uniref:putative zinc-binding protein n=1 Tax=Aeromonas veronii TaxID=654 RepID=UPI003F7AC86D
MSECLRSLPLVYSCSGCSSAAQMANNMAIQLDKRGDAEMSCIAGVGGNVKHLVRIAKSGRSIIAIDGCPLQCVKSCLSIHNIIPEHHILLNEYGVKKIQKTDFDYDEADRLTLDISNSLI